MHKQLRKYLIVVALVSYLPLRFALAFRRARLGDFGKLGHYYPNTSRKERPLTSPRPRLRFERKLRSVPAREITYAMLNYLKNGWSEKLSFQVK